MDQCRRTGKLTIDILIQLPVMKSGMKIIILLVIVGLIVASLLYYFVYDKPHTDYLKAIPEVTLPASSLFAQYVSDKHNADSLYTGKVILIEGNLSRMETLDTLKVAVFVFDKGIFGDKGIRCTFLRQSSSATAGIRPGDQVRIKGFCTGYNETDIILEHCSIID